MTFSEEQKAIIEAPIDEKTVVMAIPAAGKTATLTERIRFLLKNNVDPNKIVCLTFTNNAASEMRARLGEDFKEGMFMGTIHSYANTLLTSCGHDTSKLRIDEQFDELFEMIVKYPETLRQIDYLLCDESQDLNYDQFSFIFDILDPKACLIVGDVRQSIYDFRDAKPELLMSILSNEDFVVRELTKNYRNGKKIIEFSNLLLSKMKKVPKTKVIPVRQEDGKVYKIKKYEILYNLKKDPNWKDWAILCRSNATVNSILNMLKKSDIPAITFKQAQGSLDDLHKKIESNSVKVLTIHSSKGLEFKNVIVVDFWLRNDESVRLSYVAVTRAKDNLFICN